MQVGGELGRYRVREVLAESEAGAVYAAWDPALGREVALKLLPPRASGAAPERERQLLEEARALAQLNHPNVVRVFDVGVLDGRVFFTMERVPGLSLRAWVEREREPLRHAGGRRHRRILRRILSVYLKAGEGLRAANEAGVAGSAFSADHVLVTDDDRVLVVELGLAAAPAQGAPQVEEPSSVEAFSRALWAALHGAAPAEPPATPSQDGWPKVTQLLLRGLRPGVSAPVSLASLLAALRATLPSRALRLSAVAAVVAGLATGAIVFATSGATRVSCGDGAAQLGDAWNEAVAARIERRFFDSGAPDARVAATTTRTLLDAFAARWKAGYRDACEARWTRREQSEASFDLRMGCLRAQRDVLAAAVEALERADKGGVESAVGLVARLPNVDACADVRALELSAQWVEPATEEALATLERERRRLEVSVSTQPKPLGAEAAALVARAQALNHGPTYAACLRTYARALLRDPSQGELFAEVARRAVQVAIASGDDASAVESILTLANTTVSRTRTRASFERWMKLADSLLARSTPRDDLAANVWLLRGSAYGRYGDEVGSLAAFEKALALAISAHGREHPTSVEAAVGVGNGLAIVGRRREGRALFDSVAPLAVRLFGENHPRYAQVLNAKANLALIDRRPQDAARAYREAHRIFAARFGAQSGPALTVLGNVGRAEGEAGRTEEARALLDGVAESFARIAGPKSNQVAATWLASADVLLDGRRAREALERYERAHTILKGQGGSLAEAEVGLSRARRRLGDLGGALRYAKSAYEEAKSSGAAPDLVAAAAWALAQATIGAPACTAAREALAVWAAPEGSPEHAAKARAFLKARCSPR